jgi:hypothetical protein
LFGNEASVQRIGSIDSLAAPSSPLRASFMSLGSRRLHSRPTFSAMLGKIVSTSRLG